MAQPCALSILVFIGATCALLLAVGPMEVQTANGPSRQTGAVVPSLPAPWHVPPDSRRSIDYAVSAQADAWLRHPILGDPSFDAFGRPPGNPLMRGSEPFKWHVNVSLFKDPVSGRWYAYVGVYLDGYAFGPGLPLTHCQVYRSENQGAT